ncbi:hypothetical protein [Devosia sp.]|uniref:hypothetical protein n=1 Tax=Devosia sp. TaxID=1871048 RepID=UPI002736C89F|nr:hypothetical protein [Devosia sp.]MDP2782161.1 hypothetical protein [Devosia sp.]
MAGKVVRAQACPPSSNATTVFLGHDKAGFTDSERCAAAVVGSDAEAIVNATARTAVEKAETEDATAGADSARIIMAEAKLACRINVHSSSHNPITALRPLGSRLEFADFEANLGTSRLNWRIGPTEPVKEFAR